MVGLSRAQEVQGIQVRHAVVGMMLLLVLGQGCVRVADGMLVVALVLGRVTHGLLLVPLAVLPGVVQDVAIGVGVAAHGGSLVKVKGRLVVRGTVELDGRPCAAGPPLQLLLLLLLLLWGQLDVAQVNGGDGVVLLAGHRLAFVVVPVHVPWKYREVGGWESSVCLSLCIYQFQSINQQEQQSNQPSEKNASLTRRACRTVVIS